MNQSEKSKVKPMLRAGQFVDEQLPVNWTDEDLEKIKRESRSDEKKTPDDREQVHQ